MTDPRRTDAPPAPDTTGQLADIPSTVKPAPPAIPPTVLPGQPVPGDPAAGTVIADRYRLVEKIGEGGMGSVWRADQTHPVKRPVALKLIRGGAASAAAVARFEAERQALALMDHPHVAKVLDAGTTPAGDPFFVMELVAGVPLAKFCDDRKLDLRRRLELFGKVCLAVQHAHGRGIIHRDLKPGNVLVEDRDGEAVPRVIDFGLAKALGGTRLSDAPDQTGYGAVMGTPLYMAPEQAGGDPADVDTRADVYALGVMLYELLTGTTPIERDRLARMDVIDLLTAIQREEPPPPSSRLSALATKTATGTDGWAELGRQARRVRGELDWIALKALAKERDRRYPTAAALADDVGRYLRDEPVSAGPPSAVYRARKFVRRNRGPVAAAGVILLALLGGIAGTTWQMYRALDAEGKTAAQLEKTIQAEAKARTEADNARTAEWKASEKAAAATASKGFLQRVLRQGSALGQATRDRETKSKVTLKEALDYAALEVDGAFPGQPEIEAELRDTIGGTYYELALYEAAEEHLRVAISLRETALGSDHPDTLSSVNLLAMLHYARGNYLTAESLFRRSLAGSEATLGPTHPGTLSSINNLALLLGKKRDYAAAEPLFRRVLDVREAALGPTHPLTLVSINNLAGLLIEQDDYLAAEPLLRRALAGNEAALGASHPHTLAGVDNLAGLLRRKGDYAAAERLLRRALSTRPGSVVTFCGTGFLHKVQLSKQLQPNQERYNRLRPGA